jgi:hypothetical protein
MMMVKVSAISLRAFPAKMRNAPHLSIQSGGEIFLRYENIILASAVDSHIIAVRNILNCDDRVAKP